MVPNSEMITLRAGKGVRTSMPMGQSQPAGSRSGAGHDLVLKGNARVLQNCCDRPVTALKGVVLPVLGLPMSVSMGTRYGVISESAGSIVTCIPVHVRPLCD